MVIKKLKSVIKQPEKIIVFIGKHTGIIPARLYLKCYYKNVFGKRLDLKNPKTFNEKLQWLKLYNKNPKYTQLVDKYRVRDYVAERIGDEHLIPLLGVWDDPKDIDFDKLPNQFVLKCNHNSGIGMCICKDKSKLDVQKTKEELKKGLKQDFYLSGREWPYKGVPRKIICEKFMTDGGSELADYKIHNFNGVPKAVLVCRDRFKESGLTEDFFDSEWKHLDVARTDHPNSTEEISQPAVLDEMLELSEKLAESIPFVRTDFYDVGGKVYFGEMTFYPASGFEKFVPDNYDSLFGEWLKIPIGGVLIKQ